jgi:hypothetical protein
MRWHGDGWHRRLPLGFRCSVRADTDSLCWSKPCAKCRDAHPFIKSSQVAGYLRSIPAADLGAEKSAHGRRIQIDHMIAEDTRNICCESDCDILFTWTNSKCGADFHCTCNATLYSQFSQMLFGEIVCGSAGEIING